MKWNEMKWAHLNKTSQGRFLLWQEADRNDLQGNWEKGKMLTVLWVPNHEWRTTGWRQWTPSENRQEETTQTTGFTQWLFTNALGSHAPSTWRQRDSSHIVSTCDVMSDILSEMTQGINMSAHNRRNTTTTVKLTVVWSRLRVMM